MTREEIERLINDHSLFHGTVSVGVIMDITHLERLVSFAEAAEREACAKVCEEHWRNSGNAMECADAIRARWSQCPT